MTKSVKIIIERDFIQYKFSKKILPVWRISFIFGIMRIFRTICINWHNIWVATLKSRHTCRYLDKFKLLTCRYVIGYVLKTYLKIILANNKISFILCIIYTSSPQANWSEIAPTSPSATYADFWFFTRSWLRARSKTS